MTTAELNGKLRESGNKSAARKVRREEFLPGVLYGLKDNVTLKVNQKDFGKIMEKYGHNVLIGLSLEGDSVPKRQVIHRATRSWATSRSWARPRSQASSTRPATKSPPLSQTPLAARTTASGLTTRTRSFTTPSRVSPRRSATTTPCSFRSGRAPRAHLAHQIGD